MYLEEILPNLDLKSAHDRLKLNRKQIGWIVWMDVDGMYVQIWGPIYILDHVTAIMNSLALVNIFSSGLILIYEYADFV